jgi:peptidoglycan/LPS O-acetylase OafA/YrhL
MIERQRAILGLDLIRFMAALSVAFYHLAWVNTIESSSAAVRSDLLGIGQLSRWGWVGVPVFFVLSGFVIAFSAESKDTRAFLESRFLRLYPGAWVCATFTCVFARLGDPGASGDYLRALVLWPLGPRIDGVYWTLAIELAFYSLGFLTILSRRRLIWLGYLLAWVGIIYWLARVVFFTINPGADLFSWSRTPLGSLTLLTHGCHFAIGILLYHMWREGISRKPAAMVSACLGAGLISVAESARFFIKAQGGQGWQVVVPVIIYSVAVLAIVGAVWGNDKTHRYLGTWQGAARTAGLLTYPLYLLHDEIGKACINVLSDIPPGLAFATAVITVLLLSGVALRIETALRARLRGPLHQVITGKRRSILQ